MAVPALITDLSTTPASNSPAGSENVFPNLDDYLRVQAAFLASIRDNSGNGWVSPYLPLAGGTMTGSVINFTAATGTFSGDVQMASQNGGQLAGLRNKIINGDMRVAQRGIVSSGISTITYTLDRWIVFTGGASLSVGQSAGDGASFQYALNVVGAAGNTSCNITQRIEQRNAYPLASKQITVSARIYASASFTPTWSVDSANTADTFAATTNVATGTFSALAIGWNDVTFTTTLNSACRNGFQVSFLMGATASGNKGLTGVQLEVGHVATPFEQRQGMELALCHRYCYQPANLQGLGYSDTASRAIVNITFPVQMRTSTPSLTASSTFTNYSIAIGNGGAVSATAVGGSFNESSGWFVFTIAGATAGQGCRLTSINSALQLSAEL